jgi:hypothetical protein
MPESELPYRGQERPPAGRDRHRFLPPEVNADAGPGGGARGEAPQAPRRAATSVWAGDRRPVVDRIPATLLPLGEDGRPLARRMPYQLPPGENGRGAEIRAAKESGLPGTSDDAGNSFAATQSYSSVATDSGPIDRSPDPSTTSAGLQRHGWAAALRRIPREHALFCSVLLVAAIMRFIAMLAYLPALWFPDSLTYIKAAIHAAPDQIRPVGYSFLLQLLEPFHSVMLVAAVQHAMGLATGIAVYALLRQRFKLPAWGATLGAIPPLLSAYEIQIEHFVLSDTLFGLLVTIAVVLVLLRPVPRVWICALAGLLLAASALVRSQGLLLAIPFGVYLGTRCAGRRVLAGILAMCVMFAVPLLGYAWWFDQVYGSFELTTSTGAFLYSRVATFADCSVIKPPADERWLCLSVPVNQRQFEGFYVWAPNSPLLHGPGWEFDSLVNRLATNFAMRAIIAQPSDYLGAVWHSTFETFRLRRDPNPAGQSQDLYLFPAVAPESLKALAVANGENYQDGYNYNHGDPSTRLVQPYAGWIRSYQRFIIVPGPLLGVIVLTGLMGMAVTWRRFGGPTLLPWLTGATLIVTPAATADFDARYVIASIPVFCIAAAIGVKEVVEYRLTRERHAGRMPEVGTRTRQASHSGEDAHYSRPY